METREQSSDLFRKEAVDHYLKKHQAQGDVLRIAPSWTSWLYWVLLLIFIAGLIYTCVGRIHEYAEGPAVVKFEGRTVITAVTAGTVSSIEVQPGQHVKANQLLVRFYSAQEIAQLDQVNQEFELQLINMLRNPSDQSARQAMANLRAQRDYMETRLEGRSVRAPHAGVVSDMRIRPSHHLFPGDTILSLIDKNSELSVVAMLPGRYRPQIKPGMSLRLEMAGYRYAYRKVTIDSVGDEVIGANELRRYLWQEVADTVQISEPVILIQAKLPARAFKADKQWYSYYSGMQAKASVRVRSEPILVALIPGLKYLIEDTDE